MARNLSLVDALSRIVLSVFLVTGTTTLVMKNQWREARSACEISAIVQTAPQREALKTSYLAELMRLSVDRPQKLDQFNTEEAEQALLRSHVIKRAKVKKLPPDTLHVEYTIREPVALLYDYENIAIDEEGYLFPFHPFFLPKKLPEIYFRERFQNPLKSAAFELAKNLLQLLNAPDYQKFFNVTKIDLSRISAASYGKREIILFIQDEIVKRVAANNAIHHAISPYFPRINPVNFHASHQQTREVRFVFPRVLRLSLKNYQKDLGNYLTLRKQLLSEELKQISLLLPSEEICYFKEKIIDLRLPNLAFIGTP